MDQLELVFQLLVCLQFMYFQHNSIVVHTDIVYIHARDPKQAIIGHPNWRALPAKLGCKQISFTFLLIKRNMAMMLALCSGSSPA